MTKLLEELKTKKLTLNNRLVFPPMATEKSSGDGRLGQGILDYYDEKSKGGYISLIIIEYSFVNKQGKASKSQLSVADDRNNEGLKELANIIHKNGSKVVMQINHAGSATTSEVTGQEIVGPSVVMHPRGKEMPRELTKENIKEIVKNFKDAAKRVKDAGFDAVEIHSAHGYLLNQFYSPITNKRTDEYGGDILNRIRIHLQVIKAVREVVGEDFPVFIRLGACDYMEGGNTLEDAKIAAAEFEKAGIDILDISGGVRGYIIPGVTGQGYFSDVTKGIKEVVKVPVILTGGVTETQAAEKLLSENKADLIGVGRAIYKDSTWAKNAIENLK